MKQDFNRKIIHMCLALLTLMIGHWHWVFVFGSVLLILIFNLLILPNLKIDIYSYTDSDKPFYRSSLIMYPLSILFLMIFYAKPYVTASVWAVMGFGTGVSAISEQIISKNKLPWNKEKSWEWLFAFIVSSFISAYLFLSWTDTVGALSGYNIFLLSVIVSVICGFVTSRNFGVDENALIAVAGGIVMYLFSFIVANNFVMGILVSLAVMGLGYLVNAVDIKGGIFGFAFGWLIYLILGLAGYSLFFVYILFYYISYIWKYKDKIDEGLIQSKEYIIGVREIYSSLLLPVLFLLIYWRWKGNLLLYLFVGSLSAPLFNVVAAQLGRQFTRHPFLISTFRKAEAGTKGAISVLGTLAGIIATMLYLIFAQYHLSLPLVIVLLILIATIVSNLLKSYYYTMLAEGFEPNKELMNITHTILWSIIFIIIYLLGLIKG